ncbi:hypothetical protein ElyMa_001881500 [Elysia marginata]|uniref:Uncharacterized protein n=1 Tax=Elysia marginata TaxID=1093978 RepID=A0AAV4EPR2_9GAST|nr:hypothetical protein ElyMa_001881500 [Elysia marginata]
MEYFGTYLFLPLKGVEEVMSSAQDNRNLRCLRPVNIVAEHVSGSGVTVPRSGAAPRLGQTGPGDICLSKD